MFYQIIENLQGNWDIPGIGLFQYLSFRSMMAVITGLLIALIFGRRIIRSLQKRQIGEEIRDLGLEGQMQKKGTPTMGGLIVILSILVPVLLFCDLSNIYVIILLVTSIWLCFIGFLDDYLKLKYKNKDGLKGKYKILGQFSLGIFVAICLFSSDKVVISEPLLPGATVADEQIGTVPVNGQDGQTEDIIVKNSKSTITTIPFVKHNEFDYSWLSPFKGKYAQDIGWLIYTLIIIFIVMAVSNGANLTDGMDGLAAGISAIIVVALAILAYLSGNIIYSNYLNIMYIPNSGEVTVFMAAIIGALIGFLWYNTYPAQVFMGDTGSLALGGIIAVTSLIIRKELLLPLLCGVFFIESLSVIFQRLYFKYTKKKYGQGRRIFKMTPLHHHYQKEAGSVDAIIQSPQKAIPEAKIVVRFWIITIILVVMSIVTLKVR